MEDLGPPQAFVSLSAAFVGPGPSDTLKAASDPPPASHTGHQYKITTLKNYIQPQKLVCKQIYVLMLRLEAAAWGGTASSAVEAAPWVAIPCIPEQNNMTRHTIYHLLSTGCLPAICKSEIEK